MIKKNFFGIDCQVAFLYIAIVTFLSLYDKTGVVILGIISTFIHESFHVIFLLLLGGKPKLLALEITGIRMVQKETLKPFKQGVVLIAGCLGNFFAFIICMYMGYKEGATVNLCLGLFNLLPSYALDGGQFLVLILERFMSDHKARIFCKVVSFVVSFLLLAIGIKIFLSFKNPTLLLTSFFLFVTSITY